MSELKQVGRLTDRCAGGAVSAFASCRQAAACALGSCVPNKRHRLGYSVTRRRDPASAFAER
jgi:hypothetical protein